MLSLQSIGWLRQPCSESQESRVQTLLSSQSTSTFVQRPPCSGSQPSVVHAFPSLQSFGVLIQPVAGSQVSTVQSLLTPGLPATVSAQSTGAYEQPWFASSQVSIVHSFPSSHVFAKTQPVAESQLSVVHNEPSSQTAGVFTQRSCSSQVSTVHSSPSLQSSGAKEHSAVTGSQVSAVQLNPSSHTTETVF